MKKPARKRGPKEQAVTIEGQWKDAIKKALKKPKPKDGWPGKRQERGER